LKKVRPARAAKVFTKERMFDVALSLFIRKGVHSRYGLDRLPEFSASFWLLALYFSSSKSMQVEYRRDGLKALPPLIVRIDASRA